MEQRQQSLSSDSVNLFQLGALPSTMSVPCKQMNAPKTARDKEFKPISLSEMQLYLFPCVKWGK